MTIRQRLINFSIIITKHEKQAKIHKFQSNYYKAWETGKDSQISNNYCKAWQFGKDLQISK